MTLDFVFPTTITQKLEIRGVSLPDDSSSSFEVRELTNRSTNTIFGATIVTTSITLTRPLFYQTFVMLPIWLVFLAVFSVSILDMKSFQTKMSIYSGFLVLTIGLSLVGATSVSMIVEMMRATLISSLAVFILFEILIYKSGGDKKGQRKSVVVNKLPFLFMTFLLVLIWLESNLNYYLGFNFVLGPIYAMGAIVPLILIFLVQYLDKNRFWIFTGTLCAILETFTLMLILGASIIMSMFP